MIHAVRLGSTVFRLGLEQLLLDPAAMYQRPGSEWMELVVHASLAAPERWAGPPHGHPSRWDWGFTLRSLAEAWQRHEHLRRIARNLTPDQLTALWQDHSARAVALRRAVREMGDLRGARWPV